MQHGILTVKPGRFKKTARENEDFSGTDLGAGSGLNLSRT